MHRNIRIVFCILITVFCACSFNAAFATTYYVAATGGSNTNSCTAAQSLTTAKATINAGIKCMAGGDTLYVRAGTYVEEIYFVIPSGISPTQRTLISGYPGDARPVMRQASSGGVLDDIYQDDPVNFTWNGIDFDGGGLAKDTVFTVLVRNPVNVTFQNSDVYNCPTNCMAVDDSYNSTPMAHALFTNMKFHDSGVNWTPASPGPHVIYGHSTQFNSTDIVFDNIEVYNNTSFPNANAVQAPYAYGCGSGCQSTDWTFRNSYFHDNTWAMAISGASASAGGPGTKVYNNIFANNGKPSVWGISDSPGCALTIGYNITTGFQVYNNTFYNNQCAGWPGGGFAIAYPGYGEQSNIDIQNNIFWQNGNNDAIDPAIVSTPGFNAGHNLQNVNPSFVNAPVDFHLKTGSPAIDTGTTETLFNTDKDGSARPAGSAYDIGAYEYIGNSAKAPAAPQNLHLVP
jgi:hypothetical protein